jgi:capsular exopolysaccharide synthesis family protein
VADNHSLNSDSESDFGYGQLLAVLARRSRCFLGTVGLVLAAATVLTIREDPQYRSAMQLLVEPNYEQRLQDESTTAIDYKDYATQLNLMRSRQFIERTVEALEAEYPNLTVEGVRGSLELSQLKDTKIFQAVYVNDDPIKTQRVLETLQQIYQDYNLEQQEQRLKRGLTSINGQLNVVRQDLLQSQSALREFRQQQNLIDPAQQATAVANALNQLIQEQQTLQAEYQEAQARYNTIQQQLARSPEEALIATRLSQSARYQSLLDQLQKTELELAQRRVIFSDADPSVEALVQQRENQLGLLKQEVERVLGEVPQQFRTDDALSELAQAPPDAAPDQQGSDTSPLDETPEDTDADTDADTDDAPFSLEEDAPIAESESADSSQPNSNALSASATAEVNGQMNTVADSELNQLANSGETTSPSVDESSGELLSTGQLGALDLGLVSAIANAQATLNGLEARRQSLIQTEEWLRTELNRYPDLIAEYDRLQPEVDIERVVLEQLLKQRQEVSAELARGGFHWQVVEKPALGKKISPKPKQNALLGLVVGLFLGGIVALVRESMDEVARSTDDLRSPIHQPLLGALPIFQPPSRRSLPFLPSLPRPMAERLSLIQLIQQASFRESIDLIYKNIQLLGRTKRLSSLLITSAQPKEGKSTLAFGLAVSAARLHQRVLLIDADLRHPILHAELGLANERGLSVLLEDPDTIPSPVPVSLADFRLDILPSGPKPIDPVRLLSSPRMKELMSLFESTYDLVIVDAPSLIGIVDALQVASVCSGALLISRLNHVTQSNFQQAIAMLHSLNLLGVVVNGSQFCPSDYTIATNGHRELDSPTLQVLRN